MMIVMYGTILAVLWYGGNMIIGGTLLTGELISFLTYCTQILTSLMMIAQVFMMIVISSSSLKRVCKFWTNLLKLRMRMQIRSSSWQTEPSLTTTSISSDMT